MRKNETQKRSPYELARLYRPSQKQIGVFAQHNYTEAHDIMEAKIGCDRMDTVQTLHYIGGINYRQRKY